MVHKKYTYKDGKKYGPYLYETKRINGQIVTTYLGQANNENNSKRTHKFLAFSAVVIFSVFLIFLIALNFTLTGKAVLDLKTNYIVGEPITGELSLRLKEGELIPAHSKIVVEYDSNTTEIYLSDLIESDSILTEGWFYAEGTDISEFGKGYGIEGEKEVYPEVAFRLFVFEDKTDFVDDVPEEEAEVIDGNESGGEIVETPGEEIDQIPEDEVVEEAREEVVEEPAVDSIEPISPSITGSAIASFDSADGYFVGGKTKKGENFEYELTSEREVIIDEESVVSGENKLDASVLELNVDNGLVMVSTDYSEMEKGFGKEYLGTEAVSLNIDLEKFGFVASNSSLFNVKLIYKDNSLVEVSKDLNVLKEEEEKEEELPEIIPNKSLTEVVPNVSIGISVNTTQYGAILGEKVRWTKEIELDKPAEVSIELPLSAEDISIIRIVKEEIDVIEEKNVTDEILETPEEEIEQTLDEESADEETSIDKPVIESPEEEIVPEIVVDIDAGSLTGAVVADLNLQRSFSIKSFFSRIFRFTGFIVVEDRGIGGENSLNEDNKEGKQKDIQIFEINETISEVELEYYTPAPSISFENETNDGKIIGVSGPDDVHYENVLIYTSISENFEITTEDELKIYWYENDRYLDVERVEDTNNNSVADVVLFVTPHLSNQTYRIIVITNAEHLDENRIFISNIYNETKELDGIWSKTINDGEYVRVKFEINLTSDRDITIWPRVVSGTPIIEVYEFNQTTVIAEFSSINDDEYNKVFLTNLISESQDTFDLRIINGEIEIDHIIDPVVEEFYDGFETDLSKWNENGATAWDLTTGQEHGGAQSVLASNGNEGNLITDNIDTSDADSINVSFWFRDDDLDSTDIDLYLFDGTNYDQITESLESGTEDAWRFISFTTSDNQYFKSNFRVRFNAVLGSGENFWVDDFSVNKTTPDGDTTPPEVSINFPSDTTYNVVYDLPFNFNISLNENGSVYYSLNDGIDNISMTGNEGSFGTLFNSLNNSIMEGNYLFRAFANDTSGNTNYTESINFTLVQENVIVNGTVVDSDGVEINTTFLIYDELSGETLYNETDIYHEVIIPLNSTYTIDIDPLDIEHINRIEMESLNFSEINETFVEIINIDESNETGNFTNVFSVKPLLENFENGTIFFTAQANSLFRCVNWNFSVGFCEGSWDLFMTDLEIGQEYNFTFSGKRGYGIIDITNATHLDENRSFISNIYNETRELDEIWSETISDGHYVRVTFERNLTSLNDITIWPRNISGGPKVEVYEVDGETKLEEFTNITFEAYNTIYLTNLTGEQDTFDLKVVNGSLQFDHIIDPNITINKASDSISVTAFNSTSFVVAWREAVGTIISYRIFSTEGTPLTGQLNASATAPKGSVAKVGAVNETAFSIVWFEGGAINDTSYRVFLANGSSSTGITDFDTGVGLVGDPARPIVLNSTMMQFCHVDQVEGDADVMRVVPLTWGGGTESPGTGADGTMTPEENLQNLLGCAALNSSLFMYAFFDDADNDVTAVRMHSNSTAVNALLTTTDIDTNVGERGQVAITSINSSADGVGARYALAWYSLITSRINLTIRDINNNIVLAPITVDVNASGGGVNNPRIALATVRSNPHTEIYNWFVLAWNDRNAGNINASVFNGTGSLKHNYLLAGDENTTATVFDIYGRDDILNTGVCDGAFVFAYANDTGGLTAKTIGVDGSVWSGNCGDLGQTPDTSSPSVLLINPSNNSIQSSGSAFFGAHIIDNVNVSNASLFLYNSTGNLVARNFTLGGNSSITLNITHNIGLNGTGLYHWNFLAFDDATTSNKAFNRTNYTFVFDNLSPNVSLIAPANGTSTSGLYNSFKADFTDNINLSNATLFIYNSTGQLVGTNFTGLGNASISANLSFNLNYSGTFFWNYRAEDPYRRVAFNNTNFTLIHTGAGDTNSPLTIINLPQREVYGNSTLLVNVSLSENGSVSYSLDNGIINISMHGNQGRFGTSFNHTNTSLGDGNYLLRVFANDTSGNNNFTESVNFTIETGTTITGCRTLHVQNAVYEIMANINATGNCFNATISNFTIEGNNFNITGNGSGIGVDARGSENLVLLNAIVINFTESVSITPLNMTSGSDAGNITILDSTIGLVDISGANGTAAGGDAGNIIAKDSRLIRVRANGGSAIISGDGGDAGNVEFDDDTIEENNITLRARIGLATGDGVLNGDYPTLSFNYSYLINVSSFDSDELVSLEIKRRKTSDVVFLGINLSQVSNVTDYLSLTNHSIFVNSSGLSVLNGSGEVRFYNLPNYEAFVVLRDGSECVDCEISEPLLGGKLFLKVPGFSNYTIADVSTGGRKLNVTAENNFTHLNVSDNRIFLYIPFDTNTSSSIAYDYSNESNDGTINAGLNVGAKYNYTCIYGSCLTFDGIDDASDDFLAFASLNDDVRFADSFSVSAWVRNEEPLNLVAVNDIAGTEAQCSNGAGTNPGWYLRIGTTGQGNFCVNNATSGDLATQTTNLFTAGVWRHIVGVYNRSAPSVQVYVDGSAGVAQTATTPTNGGRVAQNFHIGRTDLNSRIWNGTIDEVILFDKALSSAEITALYDNQSARFFSRGEQIFNEVNVSDATDPNPSRANVTLHEILNFTSGTENFTIQIGNSSAGGPYIYTPEFQVSDGFIQDIPHGTPNNISVKIIFNTDSNAFYTPVLQGNLTINSYTISAQGGGLNACSNLSTSGTTYTLSANISATNTCFFVTANDTVLDGSGYFVTGNGAAGHFGINASGIANFTLKNINITNFAVSVGIQGRANTFDAGTLIIHDSKLEIVEIYGANRTTAGTAGRGGNVTLVNSSITRLAAFGGNAPEASPTDISGGSGGNIHFSNSNATRIEVQGGRAVSAVVGVDGGSGGNVTIVNRHINISRMIVNLSSTAGTDGNYGFPGLLTLNYTGYFEDIQTDYSSNLSLTLINGSLAGGEISFRPILQSNFTNLSINTRISHNLISVDSTRFASLNKTANVTLYGTPSNGVINPVILRDGVLCRECYNSTPLTDSTVRFNVSGFSDYIIGQNTSLNDCTIINQSNTYTLVRSITTSETCFVINAPNVTLDGRGFSITGDDNSQDWGVLVNGSSIYEVNNATVRNLKINDFGIGIEFQFSNLSAVANVNLSSNNNTGVLVDRSHNVTVRNSNINASGTGISLEGVSATIGSNYNFITNNTITNSSSNAISVSHGVSNIIMNNSIRESVGSAIFTADSSQSEVTDNTAEYNGVFGISDLSKVQRNIIRHSRGNAISCTAISGTDCSNGEVSNNTIFNSTGAAIQLTSSVQGTIFRNNTLNTNDYGLYITSAIGAPSNLVFEYFTINASRNDSVFVANGASDGLNFTNMTILNSNKTGGWDVRFNAAGIDRLYIKDSYIENYTFTGTGSLAIIESTRSGQIKFLTGINQSGDNFSNGIRIAPNLVTVESVTDFGLNRSANITLYGSPGASFVNPKIARNHFPCLVGMCYNFTALNAAEVIFNVSSWTNYSIIESNLAPITPTPEINSTFGTNRTHENLTVFDTIIDPEGGRINVTVIWINNSVRHLLEDFNLSFANNSFFNATLMAGNTTKNDNWTAMIRLFDGNVYSPWVNTSNLTIINTPPPAPTLSSPAHGSSTTDRTPTFAWSSGGADDDGDTVTYQLNITCYHTAGGGCGGGNDNRHVTGIAGTSHEIVGDLQYLYDNSRYYNWTARAHDGQDNSTSWAFPDRIINISALVSITLLNSTLDFGTIGQFGTNDTSDDSPSPFLVENNGNSFVNISLRGTDLWRTSPNPSDYFQYKADNYTFENGSFNWASSITTYTNLPNNSVLTCPLAGLTCIAQLNYTNATDTAEVDINVTVPPDETAGAHNATVTFTASLGE